MTLPLAGCTFGWLHRKSLTDALRELSANGLRTFELTTAPTHLQFGSLGAFEREQLMRTFSELELAPVSLNPTFVDLNLVSTNSEIRDVTIRQLVGDIELAADLGAPCVVVIPGRLHGLVPAPAEAARAVLYRGLEHLIGRASALGITLALENSPYGFLGSSPEMIEVVQHFDSPRLRITYDVANALALEDPAEAVSRVAPFLALAHVSDTWRTRWAHTSVGRGEVDFGAFARALQSAGFNGPTVYELADGEDPGPRLERDLGELENLGWSRSLPPTLPNT